jgi:hypothetical protein
MSAESSRWRRIALKVIGHASWVLPGARSGWADAMQRELDYIEDDRAALRWAIGCVMASYSSRLAARPRSRWRASSGLVVAASMLLLIAMALQVHAGDEAPLPAFDETTCDLPDMTQDIRPGPRCGADPFRLESADTLSLAKQWLSSFRRTARDSR